MGSSIIFGPGRERPSISGVKTAIADKSGKNGTHLEHAHSSGRHPIVMNAVLSQLKPDSADRQALLFPAWYFAPMEHSENLLYRLRRLVPAAPFARGRKAPSTNVRRK